MTDILTIKQKLTDRALDVAEKLLPNGKLAGREWVVGSIRGEPGESLKICVRGAKTGVWQDFAESGEQGGDLIDLWRAVKGMQLPEALDDIRAFLGMEKPHFAKPEKQYRRPEKPACTTPKDTLRTYLTQERKISEHALSVYKIGQRGKDIVFPYLVNDNLLFVKYKNFETGKIYAERDCEPVLFGWQAIDPNAREITICEGELDAPTLYDYGHPALSLPFGGGKGAKQRWIENEFERLQQFETIYLSIDHDGPGDEAVEEIVNRLGRHRCRRVMMPMKDANDCRKAGVTADEMAKCFASAKTMDPPELVRAGEFTDAVVGLFWPPDGVEIGYPLPWQKVRGKVLFRPGELTIWTGPSGSGKSQVLSHAKLEWANNGARVCEASLEMSPPQSLRRLVKQAGNIDRPSEPYIRQIMEWVNEWLWCFNLMGKASVDNLLEVFEYARSRYGCDTFIIDSLMRMGIASDDYEGQEKAVYRLVNWAVAKNVHIHLVAHSRKTDQRNGQGAPETEDIKGASEIGSNAFNIMGIWRDRKAEDKLKGLQYRMENGDGAERIAAETAMKEMADYPPVLLNVAKQRNGDWEGKCGLWFNQDSYQYRSAQDPAQGFKYVVGDGRREMAEARESWG